MADLIERSKAIDILRMDISIIPYAKAREYATAVIETIHNRLEQLPPVLPEQKVGKWIRHEDEDGEPYGHNCSICGEWYVMPYGKTKFCPNCGAKMEE